MSYVWLQSLQTVHNPLIHNIWRSVIASYKTPVCCLPYICLPCICLPYMCLPYICEPIIKSTHQGHQQVAGHTDRLLPFLWGAAGQLQHQGGVALPLAVLPLPLLPLPVTLLPLAPHCKAAWRVCGAVSPRREVCSGRRGHSDCGQGCEDCWAQRLKCCPHLCTARCHPCLQPPISHCPPLSPPYCPNPLCAPL